MNTITASLAAFALTVVTGCASDSKPAPATGADSPASSSPTSSPTRSAPAGEPEECLAAVDEWLALYDALDQASTLEDPSREATMKVLDDSAELLLEVRRECSRLFADLVSNAHDRMQRVDATTTACEIAGPDLCGTRVDDAFDRTMNAVDKVRAQAQR